MLCLRYIQFPSIVILNHVLYLQSLNVDIAKMSFRVWFHFGKTGPFRNKTHTFKYVYTVYKHIYILIYRKFPLNIRLINAHFILTLQNVEKNDSSREAFNVKRKRSISSI